MAFWDFDDTRYKGARALLIISILGILVTAFGLTLLFWSYDETPAESVAFMPTQESPLPNPEEVRLAKLKELRIELGQAVNERDAVKMESLFQAILEIAPEDSGAWSHVGYMNKPKFMPTPAYGFSARPHFL